LKKFNMPKPIKFRAILPRVRIVNRCIICRKVIPWGYSICSVCSGRNRFPRVRTNHIYYLVFQKKEKENEL